MQGFINTTAGLRPLLLEGIEKVTYSTVVTSSFEHGVLSIQYIPNSGIGGGNVYVYIPHFTHTAPLQYLFYTIVVHIS